MTDPYPELQALLDEAARTSGVPGAVVGILHGGEETVVATGVASVESADPVDGDTLFMVGSTSKTFTGALLMALSEDGVLDLDTPVSKYLPDLALADPEARRSVTARHLLTHTGGFLGDVDFEGGYGDDALASCIARFDKLPQTFAPGTVFSYSNTGFMLAGHLAEVVTGESYEQLVRTRILEPLGMRRSAFLPWEVLLHKHSVGHVVGENGAEVAGWMGISRAGNPAGGLWSSARDQLRWARFFLAGESLGTKPISDASREAAWVPQRQAALGFEEVGLSWLRTRHGDTQIVRHGGNVSFLQVSEFVTVPSEDFAVTVLTNSGGGATLGRTLVEWCVENIAGLPALAPAPALDKSADELATYAGRFKTGDLVFEVTVRGDVLQFQMCHPDHSDVPTPPPMDVVFVADDVVARAADTSQRAGRFVRDEQGQVSMLEFGGRTARRA